MTATDKELQRMEELQSILKEAADAYYNDDTEIMSNYEYDALYDELVELEESTGIILDGSITQSAGVEVSSALPKITHSSPMLSLAKTKSRDEIIKWLGDRLGCLSWKLDGSTVVLTYDNGVLKQAVTRGNGYIGEDITEQAKRFAFVPKTIQYDGELVVRGEALMTYSEFERVNSQQAVDEKYKNPRNLASGTMRALDVSILEERTIEFHPFTLVSFSKDITGEYDMNSYASQLDWLDSLGFSSVEHFIVTPENVISKINEMADMIEEQDIPSDGLVLFFDDVEYGKSLGSTGHAPRNGIAFKWADETAVTSLTDILWNTTRTGRINPIAEFEPVELEGTTVSRATLNNLTFIKDVLGIPFNGQKVKVYKANKIIPTVMTEEIGDEVTDASFKVPDTCPTCGHPVEVSNEHGSEFLMCDNPECPARQESALVHFCSRDAMYIYGLSEKTIRRLKECGIIESYADVLNIPENRERIIEHKTDADGKDVAIYHIDGMKEKTLDNLCESIEKAKNTTAARFLYALGIREIGRVASKDIMSAYNGDIEALVEDCKKGELGKVSAVEGVGDVMVAELSEYMVANENMILDLLKLVNITDLGESGADTDADNDFITGKTFVVTGDVEIFSNRNELKAYVEENGGKVTGSVSKKTDYLITNTPDSGTSKNKKAQELGIPIITEREFCEKSGMFV